MTATGRRYWIGDLHLGHGKVSSIRGFANTDDHDSAVLAPLIELSARDTVWVLGDIASSRREHQLRALDVLRAVPAQLHLIAGNHDLVSSIHRDGWKHQMRFLEAFTSVQQFGRLRSNGQQVLMSHYPYARAGDGPGRQGSRYLEFRLPDAGLPLIHAHTHHTEPHMPRDFTGAPPSAQSRDDLSMLCVSWDARRGLTTEAHINQWLTQRGAEQAASSPFSVNQ